MLMVGKKRRMISGLRGGVALHAMVLGLPMAALAQGDADICAGPYREIPEQCVDSNAGSTVRVPAEPNTEFDRGKVQNNAGFVLSIDGQPINSDPRVEDRIRRTDLALAKADVRIQYDGMETTPRLDFKVNGGVGLGEGGVAGFESHMNYPAFVNRGEIRIVDLAAPGGPRLLKTVDIPPNGTADIIIPAGRDLVAVHRVYDARGRYDETAPLSLMVRDDRGLTSGVEEGTSSLVRQRIPVFGGAVTVSSDNIPAGASVRTLGETIPPDPNGAFVIQRILPPGDHMVDVDIIGTNQDFSREVEIPRVDWFYVGIADVTYGWRHTDNPALPDHYSRGRLAFYSKSKHANGVTVTASADTTEDDLDNLFSNLMRKDPRSVLERIDPLSTYQTYGDDSTSFDDTPTSGRVYVKIEKDGNFAMWGDYKARISGNEYVRNERQLYGANAYWASAAQTSDGKPRVEVSAYASEPDTLPGRDVFQGTGGSLYVLQRQDIQIGSETISIEFRDRTTGRVLERRTLSEGNDYTVNYIQGVVLLDKPLSSYQSNGLIVTNPGGDVQINLVVQYEYAPTFEDIDGYSYGARAQTWATDKVRVGVSATKDETETADQTAMAADVLYRFGPNSFARLDYAKSEGPGYSSSFSTDGGLIVNNIDPDGGTGEAYRFETRLSFSDFGMRDQGEFGFYAERRTEGFSTLDYQTTSNTGDEELWGFYVETRPSERFRFRLSHDDYSNEEGNYTRETGVELGYKPIARVEVAFGAEYVEQKSDSKVGDRTDLAFRTDFEVNEQLGVYLFGQATIDNNGLDDNDRYGVGATYALNDVWTVDGEVSDGSNGPGGKLLFSYRNASNDSLYFGYDLDPGRQIANSTDYGRDSGRFVFGGTRKINQDWSVFAENRYDLFSQRGSLSSAYGVTYTPTQHLSFDGAIDVARIEDDTDGDFDRTAVSFGARYQDTDLTAAGRLEYRAERGVLDGDDRNSDTVLVNLSARHQVSEADRLLFSLDAAHTESYESSILNGEIVDLKLGYAHRPVSNDKFNFLGQYRFLADDYGQKIDGTDTVGPRQRSHVLSLDATYDLTRHWTVGGKLGGRWSETAYDEDDDYARNDAWLGVINAQYHLVHRWDFLAEARMLELVQAETTEVGFVGAVYRHVGNNFKLGVGYNAGKFSDDLTDLTFDDKGVFVNLVAKF